MSGVGVNSTDFNNAWWTGGNSTATGSVTGSFWNEISGATQKMQFEREEAEKARLFNSVEAQKSRDWQTEMSNTAYQRAAADMAAAGINPASLGGNASMSPASAGTATAASGPAAHISGGISNGGLLGVVMQGIGMALKANIASSAIKYGREGMNLNHFQDETKKAINAVKVVDNEVNSAFKAPKKSSKPEPKEYHMSDEELDKAIDALYSRRS